MSDCRPLVATLKGVVVATMTMRRTRRRKSPMLWISRRKRVHRVAPILLMEGAVAVVAFFFPNTVLYLPQYLSQDSGRLRAFLLCLLCLRCFALLSSSVVVMLSSVVVLSSSVVALSCLSCIVRRCDVVVVVVGRRCVVANRLSVVVVRRCGAVVVARHCRGIVRRCGVVVTTLDLRLVTVESFDGYR